MRVFSCASMSESKCAVLCRRFMFCSISKKGFDMFEYVYRIRCSCPES